MLSPQKRWRDGWGSDPVCPDHLRHGHHQDRIRLQQTSRSAGRRSNPALHPPPVSGIQFATSLWTSHPDHYLEGGIERCTPRLPDAKTTSSPRLSLWWTATVSDGQEGFFYRNVDYVLIIKWAGIKLLVHPRRIAQCILILTCWEPLFSGYSWAEPTLGLEDILRHSYDQVISTVLKCFTKLRTEFFFLKNQQYKKENGYFETKCTSLEVATFF